MEPWVAWFVSLPSCSPQFIHTQIWDAHSSSCCLAWSPFLLAYPSAPLLPVWMNVFSSIPWLSDFHTVQFSGNPCYVLFLSLLLSFFWLCKEVKCIYLHLQLGWKSCILYSFFIVVQLQLSPYSLLRIFIHFLRLLIFLYLPTVSTIPHQSVFMAATIEYLWDNFNIFVIFMLDSVDSLFSFKLRYSSLLV